MDWVDLYLEFVLICLTVIGAYYGLKGGFKRGRKVIEKDGPTE